MHGSLAYKSRLTTTSDAVQHQSRPSSVVRYIHSTITTPKAAKCSVTSAAVAVAILAVAMVMGSTDAAISKTETILTSWAGPGCSGQTATVVSCGCSDLQFYGGQDFQGATTGTFYTETGCAGGTTYQVDGGFGGIQICGDAGWRSIYIDC